MSTFERQAPVVPGATGSRRSRTPPADVRSAGGAVLRAAAQLNVAETFIPNDGPENDSVVPRNVSSLAEK